MPRLLLVLPQFPFDTASGAARSMRTICEVLATQGWTVRVLATTATEAPEPIEARSALAALGILADPAVGPAGGPRPPVRCHDRFGIEYVLLDSAKERPTTWERSQGAPFDRLFAAELASHRPDVVFGYGGSEGAIARFRRAKAAGCRIVFGLRNDGYRAATWLREFDGVLTPSAYMARQYGDVLGLESTPITSPLNLADVLAPEREPIFFTVINPSVEKGMFFVARLAEELGTRRPDIPMLIIESRGSGQLLVKAGLAGGFDLRRHANLMMGAPVPQPKEIYRCTRVLLVPSVWREAGPRVVPEALLNGIPVLVSDRGALPEFARDQGLCLPLPASLTVKTSVPVAAAAVAPWLAAIERLADEPAQYAAESARALAAGRSFHPDVVNPAYAAFFGRVAAGAGRPGGS